MLKKILFFFLLCMTAAGIQHSFAQTKTETSDSTKLVFDDIQVDIKNFSIDPKTKLLTLRLFLISYTEDQRELKLNPYALFVTDQKNIKHPFQTIQLGKVKLTFGDKTNYLHYLMNEENPLDLTIQVSNWTKEAGKPKMITLVFEKSDEEGSFISAEIPLEI